MVRLRRTPRAWIAQQSAICGRTRAFSPARRHRSTVVASGGAGPLASTAGPAPDRSLTLAAPSIDTSPTMRSLFQVPTQLRRVGCRLLADVPLTDVRSRLALDRPH